MQRKRQIAILGGGVGGMAAAFQLTATAELRAAHAVTVYQLGGRLGGKGASHRNPGANGRIEEHGLHVWGGYYDNAFAMMRACFDELQRPAGCPLATFDQAFLPHDRVTWAEHVDGRWIPWTVELERNDQIPGAGTTVPTPAEYLAMLVPWMVRFFRAGKGLARRSRPLMALWLECASAMSRWTLARRTGGRQLTFAWVWLLDRFIDAVWAEVGDTADDLDGLRRFAVVLDLAAAYVRGTIADGVLDHGFDAIDGWDYAEWLARHGARPQTLASPAVRGAYDYYFSYRHGDPGQPRLAAGAALRSIFRLLFTYKGAIFWKLAAGMGETVFGPLYEVLTARGVRFEFFHPARSLALDDTGQRIERIGLGRQVNLHDPGTPYQPLVDVHGVPCFRHTPDPAQVVQGVDLAARGIDLEDAWADWADVGARTLTRGQDFDDVVIALPPAVLLTLAAPLADQDRRWRDMLSGIETVPTQAVQLWLRETPAQLGWEDGTTVLTAFAKPLDTWADFTHTLAFEDWGGSSPPAQVAYMCAVLPDQGAPSPEQAPGWTARQRDRVAESTRAWLEGQAWQLWPRAAPGGLDGGAPEVRSSGPGFRWDLLVAPPDVDGPDRLGHQYMRANVSPSDRYTLALPGTTALRLRAGDSGFENVFLAGDWVRTGLNLGCVESAVMAGFQAARAITGQPVVVVGEHDLA